MEILFIIICIFALMFLMSIGGWILKGLGFFAGIFFEGVGSCLGCLLKFGFWFLLIIILFLGIFA